MRQSLQELSNYIHDEVDPVLRQEIGETRGFLPFRSVIATGCIPSCHSIWEFDFALLAVAGSKRHFEHRLDQLGMIKVRD